MFLDLRANELGRPDQNVDSIVDRLGHGQKLDKVAARTQDHASERPTRQGRRPHRWSETYPMKGLSTVAGSSLTRVANWSNISERRGTSKRMPQRLMPNE